MTSAYHVNECASFGWPSLLEVAPRSPIKPMGSRHPIGKEVARRVQIFHLKRCFNTQYFRVSFLIIEKMPCNMYYESAILVSSNFKHRFPNAMVLTLEVVWEGNLFADSRVTSFDVIVSRRRWTEYRN